MLESTSAVATLNAWCFLRKLSLWYLLTICDIHTFAFLFTFLVEIEARFLSMDEALSNL